MAEFFEFDPDTGIKTETSFDEMTQQLTIHRTADVEPYLKHAQLHRNEKGRDAEGIAEGWHHYATLPPVVQVMLRAKGFNLDGGDNLKDLLREINEHWAHLKMTTGNEGTKAAPVYFLPNG